MAQRDQHALDPCDLVEHGADEDLNIAAAGGLGHPALAITVRGLPLGQLQETAIFAGRGAPAAANSGRIISIARPSHCSRVSLL